MARHTLEQRAFLYDTYVKYYLLESIGENFDVNFVMEEFSADKQFTIWWINLDQRDSNRQETKT
jgi:hypothetical protein